MDWLRLVFLLLLQVFLNIYSDKWLQKDVLSVDSRICRIVLEARSDTLSLQNTVKQGV